MKFKNLPGIKQAKILCLEIKVSTLQREYNVASENAKNYMRQLSEEKENLSKTKTQFRYKVAQVKVSTLERELGIAQINIQDYARKLDQAKAELSELKRE